MFAVIQQSHLKSSAIDQIQDVEGSPSVSDVRSVGVLVFPFHPSDLQLFSILRMDT